MSKIPIILLAGQAGAGKDEARKIICRELGYQGFAFADTIKAIAKDVFGFTHEQLWGPSEFRNALDTRWASGTSKYVNLFCHKDDEGETVVNTDIVYRSFSNHCPVADGNRLYRLCETFLCGLKVFTDKEYGLTARICLQLLGTEVGRAYDRNLWADAGLRKAERALLDGAPGAVISDGRFRNEIMTFRKAGAAVIKIYGVQTLASTHSSETEIQAIPDTFFDVTILNDKNHGLDGFRAPLMSAVRLLTAPLHYTSIPVLP